MKPNQIDLISVFVGLSLLISSCGGGGEKKEAPDSAASEFEAAKEQMASDVKKVLRDLPPPSEVPYLLMATGADYDENIVNELESAVKYQGDKAKAALNLGIYASDIAYMTSYDKSETALEYMNECQKLATPIGVADAIDLGMVARFEKNMENKDSLAIITNDIIETTEARLSELDEMESAALLLAGSWIEGIYLSTSIINNYPENLPDDARTLILEPIVKIVIDQKASLDDLLAVLNDVPDSPNINSIEAELQKVKHLYDGEIAEIEQKIAGNTGDFVLTPVALTNLSQEISRIRGNIVQ